jgi:hypothetical protein
MPAANQTIAQIWLSEMPTESAAWWSSATALSARPMRVLLKNTASTADHDDGDHRRRDIDVLQDQQPAVADLERRRSGRQPQFGSAIICLGSPPKMNSPKPIRK